MAIRNFEGINKCAAEKEAKEQKEFEAKEQFVMGCLNEFADNFEDLKDVIETERYAKSKKCAPSLDNIGFTIDTANECIEYYLLNKYHILINPFTDTVKMYFYVNEDDTNPVFLNFNTEDKHTIEMLYDKSTVIDDVLNVLQKDIETYFNRINELGK